MCSILVMSECPMLLLGRDLLVRLKASVTSPPHNATAVFYLQLNFGEPSLPSIPPIHAHPYKLSCLEFGTLLHYPTPQPHYCYPKGPFVLCHSKSIPFTPDHHHLPPESPSNRYQLPSQPLHSWTLKSQRNFPPSGRPLQGPEPPYPPTPLSLILTPISPSSH